MKKKSAFSKAVLFARHFLAKLAENFLHPMKDLPTLDFNNQYDSTML